MKTDFLTPSLSQGDGLGVRFSMMAAILWVKPGYVKAGCCAEK